MFKKRSEMSLEMYHGAKEKGQSHLLLITNMLKSILLLANRRQKIVMAIEF